MDFELWGEQKILDDLSLISRLFSHTLLLFTR
jgi:hypothetical protein